MFKGDLTISTEKALRVNEQIRARSVRLIDENGEQIDIVPIQDALKHAEEVGMDLVELNPNAEPPVCRIMDYGKYAFQLNKRRNVAKKKQKQVQTKEMKYTVGIEDGDYQVKLKKIEGFIAEGDKVKITIRFRGREASHQELGFRLIDRIQVDVEPFALVEQVARFEGRQIVTILSPKKAK